MQQKDVKILWRDVFVVGVAWEPGTGSHRELLGLFRSVIGK